MGEAEEQGQPKAKERSKRPQRAVIHEYFPDKGWVRRETKIPPIREVPLDWKHGDPRPEDDK